MTDASQPTRYGYFGPAGTFTQMALKAWAPEADATAYDSVDATLAAVREAVIRDVLPRSSWRASKEFRMQIIRTLAERVLAQAAQRAGGELSC